MNEPIINPWIFYWLDVLHTLKFICAVIAVFSGCGVCMFFLEHNNATEHLEYALNKEKAEATQRGALRKMNKSIILFIVFLFAWIFVPTDKTVTKMLVAKQITQHNLNVAGETTEKLIDKAIEKMERIKGGNKHEK